MFDARKLLDQLVSSGVAGGLAGGLAGGALANALSGKKARKVAGSALKLGGAALVGGLAYKAWNNYQQKGNLAGAGGTSPVAESAFLPDGNDPDATQSLNVLLARAMISAAKADGQVDAGENQAILNQINGADLSSEDKAFLFDEYAKPLDVRSLVRSVDSPEHAAEVYAASLLMVSPPTAPEQHYLDGLARELGLDAGLVDEIHAMVRDNSAAA